MSSKPDWDRQNRLRHVMSRAYCSPGSARSALGVETDIGRTAIQHAAAIEHDENVARERAADVESKRQEFAENAERVEREEATEAKILAMTPEEFDQYRKGRRGKYTEPERALMKKFMNSRSAVEPETF